MSSNPRYFLMYNLSFLEMEPAYEVRDVGMTEFRVGVKSEDLPEFCDENTTVEEWRINWDKEISIHNWMTDLDLHCTSRFNIGLIGTGYFVGFIMACIFIARGADKYGRKLFFIVGLSLHTISAAIVTLFPSLTTFYICFIFIGAATPTHGSIGYVYMMENLPKDAHKNTTTMFLLSNATIPLFSTLYFIWISNNWVYLEYIGIAIGCIGIIGSLYIPESPRWLIAQKKFPEARKVFEKIANVNGAAKFEGIFEGE
jgi:MFS family permease